MGLLVLKWCLWIENHSNFMHTIRNIQIWMKIIPILCMQYAIYKIPLCRRWRNSPTRGCWSRSRRCTPRRWSPAVSQCWMRRWWRCCRRPCPAWGSKKAGWRAPACARPPKCCSPTSWTPAGCSPPPAAPRTSGSRISGSWSAWSPPGSSPSPIWRRSSCWTGPCPSTKPRKKSPRKQVY